MCKQTIKTYYILVCLTLKVHFYFLNRQHLLDGSRLWCDRGGQAQRLLPLCGNLSGSGQTPCHYCTSRERVRKRACFSKDLNVYVWTWENNAFACVQGKNNLGLMYLFVQVSVLDGVGSVSTHRKVSSGRFGENSSCQCQHQLAQWHLHWLPGLYINMMYLFSRTSLLLVVVPNLVFIVGSNARFVLEPNLVLSQKQTNKKSYQSQTF